MEHNPDTNNTFINTVLCSFAAMFTIIEQSTADEIYTWIFRTLTLVSLTLMIVINWKKAWNTLFNHKKNQS